MFLSLFSKKMIMTISKATKKEALAAGVIIVVLSVLYFMPGTAERLVTEEEEQHNRDITKANTVNYCPRHPSEFCDNAMMGWFKKCNTNPEYYSSFPTCIDGRLTDYLLTRNLISKDFIGAQEIT